MSSDFYKLTVNTAIKETDDCVSLSFDIPEEIKDKLGKDLFETEEDIFKFINLDYVIPEDRNTTTLSKIL